MVYGTPDTIKEVEDLFELSIAQHHEGIMIKDAGEPYIPGLRGKKCLNIRQNLKHWTWLLLAEHTVSVKEEILSAHI